MGLVSGMMIIGRIDLLGNMLDRGFQIGDASCMPVGQAVYAPHTPSDIFLL